MVNLSQIKDMKVLIVEDQEGLAELLAEEIGESGLQARWTASAEEARPLISSWLPDLVVSDLRLPGADGLELLQQVRAMESPPAFLVITAFGTVTEAVEALKAGADDFLTKPLDLEHFKHRMASILETRKLREEVQGFRRTLKDDHTFYSMYGQSRSMQALFNNIKQVALADGPVLIYGESGTGKELVARAIHGCSERAEKPFQAVNCAGIPENLMESEFFGHAAGAFTGAQKARRGLFQAAESGSLLLDEIAEMPLALQSKLLRILQDGRVRPVGANQEEQVDVRVIAATNQDLEKAVEEGRFRDDLFYRLETFMLRVPPLREREEDVELLSARFLVHYSSKMGKRIQGFREEALELIRRYSFPGNVRELQNAVERAVAFCDEERIAPKHLPARIRENSSCAAVPAAFSPENFFSSGRLQPLSEIEQAYIKHVLKHTGGNKKKAADILGISRRSLYQRLESKDSSEP